MRRIAPFVFGAAALAIVAIIVGPWLVGTIIYPSTPKKRAGVDWQPDKFRPREERPLPSSSQIEADHRSWLASNTNMISRVYTARLGEPSRQSDFKVEYQRMSSPLGNPWWTYASYRYTDPTNGSYIILWRQLGRHKPEFLKLDARPRLHWLAATPEQIEFRGGIPVLEVVGIEEVTKFCAY
jgi:hypothetical protein